MNKRLVFGLSVYIGMIFILAFLSAYYLLPRIPPEKISEDVGIRVIDGDTFEINGEVVRLICIDSPEKSEIGFDEATQFLENLIMGNELRLEKDVNDKDEYGRLLRYVYVSSDEDEIFVNREMVKSGNAEVFRYGEDVSKCDEVESKN
ncbi:hypothetical protein COU54_03960 [Candidatus Pacearchaeota archaeon CG10_big_fil_rev_8_21_14_0_10_31_24]|nr:MAG: hypothetical protein COU54_03960 [Candidatus Pacearchaeota archaeon CG10_big_fil_rev_8_21_14_0_10_31_24]